MSKQTAQIIAAYVARVDEIQKDTHEELSARELKDIARELGLSDADLARADRTAQDHLSRGRGYLDHGLLDDAIAELRSAVVLRPLDAGMMLALAEAFAARFAARSDPDDRQEADQLAKQALELDPALQGAFALRRQLADAGTSGSASAAAVGEQATSRSPLLPLLLMAGGAVAAVALVGVVLLFVVRTGPAEAPVAPMVQEPATVAAVEAAPPAERFRGQISAEVAPYAALPELALAPQQVELSEHPDSWALKVNGRLQNGSDKLVTTARAQVELLAADGTVVHAKDFKVFDNLTLRPGDTEAWYTLVYEEGYADGYQTPVSARFSILSAELDAAAASYPPAAPADWAWGEGVQHPGLDVNIEERFVRTSDGILGQVFFEGVYEVTVAESSAAVKTLRLQFTFLGEDGAVLLEDEQLVVFSSEPSMQPGEMRVQAIHSPLPKAPAAVKLKIVEAK